MSFDKIQKMVGNLAKEMGDNEKFATPVLAAKLSKCAKAYPYDQTIGSIFRIMEKMADNKFSITRKEIKDLYTKTYSRDTKFASLFEEELGALPELNGPKFYDRSEIEKSPIEYKADDEILANALTTAFDNTVELKTYSQEMGKKVINSVAGILDGWNLRAHNLTVDNGNEKFIVIRADYNTPKGITSFYIPVELHGKKVAEATLFVGNCGVQDLIHSNIKKYLTSSAGTRLKVTGSAILNTISKAANENREISDVEIAMIKLKASRAGNEINGNGILGVRVAEVQKQVNLPKSDEFESFEKMFTTASGYAKFSFGENVIGASRELISRKISNLGYLNSQIKITKTDKNTIFYGVSLDNGKVAFTVPMKVVNSKVIDPSVFLCNGKINLLNKNNINDLYVKNQSDFKVAAAASPMGDLKPSDLIDNIRDAVRTDNREKAEDALNVLANSGDEKAYAIGFNIYLNTLNCKKAEVGSCSKIIKKANSQHEICGHTNLPVHKTYIDEQGYCRPLYRRSIDENYEPAAFINSKIFG